MKDIQIFRYEDNDVRTMEINGEPWFVLKDVCNALEIANVSNVAIRLDADEKGIHQVDTLGGKQEVICINESGLYNVICVAISRKRSLSASGSPVRSCPVSAKWWLHFRAGTAYAI